MNIPRKFYLRREELKPDTAAQNAIRQGLWMQGVETVDYFDPAEIAGFDDLGPDVGVAGYIGDVQTALLHLGRSLPPNMDYPKELAAFRGRRIFASTLGEVRAKRETCFIKPARDHKLFTGFVWSDTAEGRRDAVAVHDDIPVWVSDPVRFVSEYRTFVLEDEILDCRRYKGDWSKAPNRKIVEQAVDKLKGVAPVAYCVDFGVTHDGATLLVEMNDGYAMGPYGLAPPQYACMITARWRQLIQ